MNTSPGIRCRVWTGVALLSVLVLTLAASVPVEASRIRPLNLEELSQRAGRIFSGRCVGIRVHRDAALGQRVTEVTFAPRRAVKGKADGVVTSTILGDQAADSPAPRHGVVGSRPFRRGEDVVLFLYGVSRHGLTSPVRFAQGKLVLAPDGKGRAVAINGYANAHRFTGLSARAASTCPAAPTRARCTSCTAAGLGGTSFVVDAAAPPVGDGWFYVVTGAKLAGEGPLDGPGQVSPGSTICNVRDLHA